MTIWRCFILLLCSVLLISSDVWAAPRLAVMDLRPVGVEDNLALAVSENLRTMIIHSRRYEVVERTQLKTLLDEFALEQSGLTHDEHARQLGQLANVDLILLGSLDKIFDCYSINTRVIEIDSGVVIKALKADIESHAEFPSRIDQLALEICQASEHPPLPVPATLNASYRLTGPSYSGLLHIRNQGNLHRLNWQLTDDNGKRLTFDGYALLRHGILSGSYHDAQQQHHGLVAYDVLANGGQLRGLNSFWHPTQTPSEIFFEHAERLP